MRRNICRQLQVCWLFLSQMVLAKVWCDFETFSKEGSGSLRVQCKPLTTKACKYSTATCYKIECLVVHVVVKG
jgi:hypothetical protein